MTIEDDYYQRYKLKDDLVITFHEAFLVLNDSPAAEAGMKEGDEILSVNGLKVSALSLDRLRDLFKQEGAMRRVRLVRDGRHIDVVIKLRRLL